MFRKQFVYMILSLVLAVPAFSQSIQDLEKLRKQYRELQQAQQAGTASELGLEEIQTGLPEEAALIPGKLLKGQKKTKQALEYFGYDFFTQRDTVLFWENLPTPANYLLGPGDEVVISLWGETQLRQTYTISRDGSIYVDKVGLLYLTGKTMEVAREYLRTQFERVYATLKGKTATTFMDVSLGRLKTINVNFVGEVTLPGIHPVHPFSTVITGLIQAGGVDTTGSLRKILLKRSGEKTQEIDLYTYLLEGDLPANIQLRDQDIIVVPVRESTVSISGAVVRPGKYEAIPGESIQTVLDYAGDVKQNAASTIELLRIKDLESRMPNEDPVEQKYLEYEAAGSVTVRDGDRIIVHELPPFAREVYIYGQVKNPGAYAYEDSMTILDLLALAGSFEDSTYWKTIYQERAEIIRRDENSRYNTVIEVSLKDLVNGQQFGNYYLQNLDQVVVHQNTKFFEPQNVKILGEVNVPGTYPLMKDGETLGSIIERAGGLTPRAFEDGIEINRDTLKVVWEDYSIPIQFGDSIIVRKRPGVVFVNGEVYNPGLIAFKTGNSLKDYIESAGGVTPKGNKHDIMIVYANGDVRVKKLLWSPKVRDGAMIVVNKKKEKAEVNVTQLASVWAQLISSVITIAILARQL